MEMEKVADAPGVGHGRGRGCSGGSNHLRHAHHLNAPLECGVKSARDSSKKYAELAKYDFFFRRSWPNGGLGSPTWTS